MPAEAFQGSGELVFKRGIQRNRVLPHSLHHLVDMRVEFAIGVLDYRKQDVFQFIVGQFYLFTYSLYSVACCLYPGAGKLDAIMSGPDFIGSLPGGGKQYCL